MKEIEYKLYALEEMLRDDGYNGSNIVMQTLNELREQLKNCNLQNVSVSLLHQKAIEYAKIIHQEEFDDHCFAPDVEQTIRDFKIGFEAAIIFSNER